MHQHQGTPFDAGSVLPHPERLFGDGADYDAEMARAAAAWRTYRARLSFLSGDWLTLRPTGIACFACGDGTRMLRMPDGTLACLRRDGPRRRSAQG